MTQHTDARARPPFSSPRALGEARLANHSHARVPVRLGVCIRRGGESRDGVCLELGIGGMFVECAIDVPHGSGVSIELQDDRGERIPLLSGVVRWRTTHGFGIQFGPLGVHATRAVASIVTRERRELESVVDHLELALDP